LPKLLASLTDCQFEIIGEVGHTANIIGLCVTGGQEAADRNCLARATYSRNTAWLAEIVHIPTPGRAPGW
jgi:hypothetical protein